MELSAVIRALVLTSFYVSARHVAHYDRPSGWAGSSAGSLFVSPTSPDVYRVGRFYDESINSLRHAWPSTQISIRFAGAVHVSVWLQSHAMYSVDIDGIGSPVTNILICDSSRLEQYTVASDLNSTKTHTITLRLRSEPKTSNATTPLIDTTSVFGGFTLSSATDFKPELKASQNTAQRRMVVIGDSISAGWGATSECCGLATCRSPPCASDGPATYGSVAAAALGAEVQIIASGGNGFSQGNRSGCSGGPGPTPFWTEPPLQRLFFETLEYYPPAGQYDVQEFIPDVVVINVGTNDGESENWFQIYVSFLQKLRAAWPKAYFFLGCAPMVNRDADIAKVISLFADPVNRTHFLNFGDTTQVERGCFEHPSIAGHRTMAAVVVAAVNRTGCFS